MRVRVGQAEVILQQGDITEMEVDAVVNAANNHLWMGSGVAGAIKRKGGESIEREAVAKGPVPVGEAVITGGGSLKAKHVIHAAGMGQDLKTDQDKIRLSTRNSLLRAEEHKLRSVAFPAIGTGVGGLSAYLCAKVMLEETVEFLQESQSLRKVAFALLDEGTYRIFKEQLSEMFSAHEHP
jgi:O-acetyl-ADP-ribose deacetylase (regulator of RNase III)